MEVVGYSRYKDQAALDAHFKTDYFQELGKQIEAEGLLAKPLNIMTLQPIGGFDSR
jgi:quinol monooxygenase YgiN